MMKWLITKQAMAVIAIAVVVFLFPSLVRAADMNDPNNDSLFDPNRIHSYYFTMDPNDWDDMVADCDNEQCIPDANCEHQYWQATLECGDLGPMLVGIRRKNGFAEPNEANPQKVSLKIDINLFTPGQLFAGKKKLSLENGGDSALVSEGITWLIYGRTGITCSLSAWVKVYVNGSYRGLYNNVEQVDKRYLADHGLDGISNTGFLYKCSEYCGEVQRTREAETSPFEFNWYPFDHPDYMTETIPPPNDWLAQTQWRVDIPHLLKLAAVENFTSNGDALLMKGTNFWYYDWSTGPNDDPNFQQPRLYLPWDLDKILGDTGLPIMQNEWTGHLQEGLIDEVNESGISFGYPTHQADYLDTYDTLLDGPLELSSLIGMVNDIEAVIGAEVDADPYTLLGDSATEFQRIRDFLSDRTDYVTAQLEALTPPPGIVLLDDGFEGAVWDANWTNSGTWVRDDAFAPYELPSAQAPAKASGTFTCADLNTSDAETVHVRFWLQKDDTDTAGDITLYYYNGTSYVNVSDLATIGDDDTWLYYTDAITDSNYFVSNFKIRFDAVLGNGENVWVDDVIITKTVPPLIYGYILDPCAVAVSGVSVDANNAGGSDTSDANGYYEVEVPYDWSGTVTPTKAGYTFSPTDRSYSNVTTDQNDQDYTATLLTYTISGTILDPGVAPVPGVAVDADNGGGSDVTDANGQYSLTVDYDWSGTVTPTKTDYTFNPTSKPYSNVTADQTNQDYVATSVYDLYPDGIIDLRDLDVLCEAWLTSDPDPDYNADNIVNFDDYEKFSRQW